MHSQQVAPECVKSIAHLGEGTRNNSRRKDCFSSFGDILILARRFFFFCLNFLQIRVSVLQEVLSQKSPGPRQGPFTTSVLQRNTSCWSRIQIIMGFFLIIHVFSTIRQTAVLQITYFELNYYKQCVIFCKIKQD